MPGASREVAERRAGEEQPHGEILTGFCRLVLAVPQQLEDVHLHLGLPRPLRRTVDAVFGQGDGEPLPSAALHRVIQDGSCGIKRGWQRLGSGGLHTPQTPGRAPPRLSSTVPAASLLLPAHPPSCARPFAPFRPPPGLARHGGGEVSAAAAALPAGMLWLPTLLSSGWCQHPRAPDAPAGGPLAVPPPAALTRALPHIPTHQ